MDAVTQIQAFNAGRDPERLQLKYDKMRASAFAFLRGTCHLFYARLAQQGQLATTTFKAAPLTWACGDLHLENFGSYKADNRLVYFDINDFDESALAPASWDLARMLASLRLGADALKLGDAEAEALCGVFLDAYCAALATGKAYWVERETATGLVRTLLDDLRDRPRASFLDSRTQLKGKKRGLKVDGKKALPASDAQRAAVTAFMADFAATQADADFFEVLDVARRIAGTGSLGIERYVILARGKGSPDGNYLLDLKQSPASSLTPYLDVAQPAWRDEAQRAVTLQDRMQAVPMAFLQPVMLGKNACVLRGLQPSGDRVTLDRASQTAKERAEVVATMGRILAWDQLRSAGRDGSATADVLIGFGQSKKWNSALQAAARDCADQARADAATFNAAYDDGVFHV